MDNELDKAIDEYFRVYVKFPPQRDPARIARVLKEVDFSVKHDDIFSLWDALYCARENIIVHSPEDALAKVFVVGTHFQLATDLIAKIDENTDDSDKISRSTVNSIALEYGKALYKLSKTILRQEFLNAGKSHLESYLSCKPEDIAQFYGLLSQFYILDAKSRRADSRIKLLECARNNISLAIENEAQQRERHYLTLSHIHLLLAQSRCYNGSYEKIGEHIDVFHRFFNDGVNIYNDSYPEDCIFENAVQGAIEYGHEIIEDLLRIQADEKVKNSVTLIGDDVVEVSKYLTDKCKSLSRFFWTPNVSDLKRLSEELKKQYHEEIYKPQLEELAKILG